MWKPSTTDMRIISWNMAGGFAYDADKHERAWRYLKDLDPDVALLQEVVIPAWAEGHWPSIVAARKYAPVFGKPDVPWGSSILTKSEAVEAYVPEENSWLKELWGSVCLARLGLKVPLWLASIHSNAYPLSPERLARLPLGELRRCHEQKLWEIEIIARELVTLTRGEDLVAGGDLNSGLLFDKTYRYDNNERLFSNLAEQGLVDLRVAAGIEEEQQTYFKEGRGPYQLDHVFASAGLADRVKSWRWRVLSEVAERGLSDHAPIEIVCSV